MSAGSSRSDVTDEVRANEYRARADAAFRATVNAPPPGHLPGESVTAYRLRLLDAMKGFSPTYRKLPTESLASMARAGALGIAEETVFQDAVAAGRRPTGKLRAVDEPDGSGRVIRKFYGSPEECWGPFKLPVRRVSRFNCPNGEIR